jgi:guanylate kinase
MSGLRAPVALVLAGPSGGGKTTVCRRLRERRVDVEFSVSATTRTRRRGERDGVDYRFLSRPEFEALVESDGLLEWAEVHGELYGTPRGNLDAARRAGRSLLLDIDVQGARQVRERAPESVLVFLLPPSGPELLRRLHGRGSESEDQLRRRLRTALTELAAVDEFDYVVENDDLEQTVAAIEAILEAESLRTTRSRERIAERAGRLRDALAAGVAGAEP